MLAALVFGLAASNALVLGAGVGARFRPSNTVTGV